MRFDFSDQVVMVTVASGNLGSTVALAFRAAGARLALIDLKLELLQERFPSLVSDPHCFMSACDMMNSEQTIEVTQAIVDHFGRVDCLANTVGGYRAGTPVHETPLKTWEFMIKLNASTVFIANQAVIPHMLRQGRGKIVHTAARPGLEGSAKAAAYSASKAAVLRIVESSAAEVRDQGINVNCIIPGTLDTPENREAMPDANYGKWVQPESLADVILFLCSEEARDIHGAAVPVYGLT